MNADTTIRHRLSLPSLLSLKSPDYRMHEGLSTSRKSDVTWTRSSASIGSLQTRISVSENLQKSRLKDYLAKERPCSRVEAPMFSWGRYTSARTERRERFRSLENLKTTTPLTKVKSIHVRKSVKLLKKSLHKECTQKTERINYNSIRPHVKCLAKYPRQAFKQAEWRRLHAIKHYEYQLACDREPLLASNPKREWKVFDPDQFLKVAIMEKWRDVSYNIKFLLQTENMGEFFNKKLNNKINV
eukprot:TRINITY_DN15181_c0_g3_i8.p1 TRINITY_DN15181_c0_g3~~TRINITY_DN15181_c0_g3_i8.p1  ORF type:complete len:243 (-),score=25.90 TRINITY_DN15181_c0_g3_i8:131-859(-)